jgi:triacylglycerol lipase
LTPTSPRNPLVLLHGLGDTSRLFKRLKRYLEERGWDIHTVDLVPNNGRAGLEVLARQVAAYIDCSFAPDQIIDLIGFSMGGLVARYYLQRLGGLRRVHRLVTISSPHQGTWTAYALRRTGVKQMRPGSAFLRDLESDRHKLSAIRFTSIWTPLDLMIVPARSSVLREARMVRLVVSHHARMVGNQRVMQAVEAALLD